MDGQTEVVNRYVEQFTSGVWFISGRTSGATTFHKLSSGTIQLIMRPREWPLFRHYMDVYLLQSHYYNGCSSVQEVDQSLEAQDELLRQLKCNVETSINRM
jgi:hypothetical protein